MDVRLRLENGRKYALLTLLTKGILTLVLLDAAYVYRIVERMFESVHFAMRWYYAIPHMTEHLLSSVACYLACMVLISRISRAETDHLD